VLNNKAWPDPVQIKFSGSGGQGLILAGIILAEAALSEGSYAVQTQAYGPEARGGASSSEVIIGTSKIDFLHIEEADILLALTQEACKKYLPMASREGLIILDSLLVPDVPATDCSVLKLPIVETARVELGKEVVANIVALGAFNSATNLVSWSSLEKAVINRVPKALSELNIKALAAGRQLVNSN
jgi:2-oxoglutarate ferredoxin oxidoreductase subunit gamma